jgi:hypothetical protein
VVRSGAEFLNIILVLICNEASLKGKDKAIPVTGRESP